MHQALSTHTHTLLSLSLSLPICPDGYLEQANHWQGFANQGRNCTRMCVRSSSGWTHYNAEFHCDSSVPLENPNVTKGNGAWLHPKQGICLSKGWLTNFPTLLQPWGTSAISMHAKVRSRAVARLFLESGPLVKDPDTRIVHP